MKKLFYTLSIILSSVILHIASAEVWNGFEYSTTDNGPIILSYTGSEKYLNIPFTLDNVYVAEIAPHAFEGNMNLVTVTMPATITKIGERAFADCGNLETVNISNGLKELGSEAFMNCSKLTMFTLPVDLQFIGQGAFRGCSSLYYINDLTGTNPLRVEQDVFQDTEWFKRQTEPFITISQGYVLIKYQGNESSPDLPWYLISIAEDAFADCNNVTELKLPNYIRSLERGSISGMSSLQSVSGGDGITSVAEGAFEKLPELRQVDFANISLTSKNFLDCPLVPYGSERSSDDVTYDASAPDEADILFDSVYDSDLDGIIILHCINDAFFENGVVDIPDKIRNKPVIIIGPGACQNRDDINKIILPDNLIGIKSWAFSYDKNLNEVIFPDGLKWIESDAFNNSGITNNVPVLPGVDIDSRAFYRSEK